MMDGKVASSPKVQSERIIILSTAISQTPARRAPFGQDGAAHSA